MRLITKKKVGMIAARLSREGVEAAVFVSSGAIEDRNVQYLTGMGGVHAGALILIRGRTELLVSALDYDRAVSEAGADEITKADGEELGRILAERCAGLKKVGCVKAMLTAHSFEAMKRKGLKLSDIGEAMAQERAEKEPRELEAIERCAGMANGGIRFLSDFLAEGAKENDVSAELERRLRKLGSEKPPFDTIVTSGKRSAFIHPSPAASAGTIGKGLGLVDFGATFHGYVCDVTVPFTCGKLTKGQQKIEDAVMDARDVMEKLIRPGAGTAGIYDAFEKRLRAKGLEAKHSAGHGIGLDVHEYPSLSGRQPATLRAGMALAVEPGAYVPGTGGLRVENDFIVTKNGCRKLTKSSLIRL